MDFVKWSSQGMLRMSPDAMNTLFKPTVDHIIQHLSKLCLESLEYCIMCCPVNKCSQSAILSVSGAASGMFLFYSFFSLARVSSIFKVQGFKLKKYFETLSTRRDYPSIATHHMKHSRAFSCIQVEYFQVKRSKLRGCL